MYWETFKKFGCFIETFILFLWYGMGPTISLNVLYNVDVLTVLFNNSPICGYLGCSQNSAIINSAAVNSLHIYIFLIVGGIS